MLKTGQRVIRYMGVAGGFWHGHVLEVIDDAHVRVAFGLRKRWDGTDTFDVAMPFDVDEYLFEYPETAEDVIELSRVIRAQLERDAPMNGLLNRPLWPRGYFGELERLVD